MSKFVNQSKRLQLKRIQQSYKKHRKPQQKEKLIDSDKNSNMNIIDRETSEE